MKLLILVSTLIFSACSSNKASALQSCNIEFVNTYLEKCQSHCGYEDSGYNCADTCFETAKMRYCN